MTQNAWFAIPCWTWQFPKSILGNFWKIFIHQIYAKPHKFYTVFRADNTCRACAAFFRRTICLGIRYNCKMEIIGPGNCGVARGNPEKNKIEKMQKIIWNNSFIFTGYSIPRIYFTSFLQILRKIIFKFVKICNNFLVKNFKASFDFFDHFLHTFQITIHTTMCAESVGSKNVAQSEWKKNVKINKIYKNFNFKIISGEVTANSSNAQSVENKK